MVKDPLSRDRISPHRVRTWLREAFVLLCIVSLFIGMALLHARLGGFDTYRGSAVGVILIVLWFSPSINYLIRKGYETSRSGPVNMVLEWLRVGSLLFTILATSGVVLAFAVNPTGDGLLELMAKLWEVISS